MRFIILAALAAMGFAASAPKISGAPGQTHQLRGLYTRVHVAKAGDSIASLVLEYGTTRGALESINPGLDLEHLKPGDRVYVMSRPGVFQKVQSGLTISDVARAYQVNSEYL